MQKRKSMFEIAALLDDTIERGEKIGRLTSMSLSELALEHRRLMKSERYSPLAREAVMFAKSRIERLIDRHRPDDIKKSLSFNPAEPHEMNYDSNYYNPYRQLADGSYAPHQAAHWMQQEPTILLDGEFGGRSGRSVSGNEEAVRRDGYREVDRFYQAAGVVKSELYAVVDDLVKAIPSGGPKGPKGSKGLPVGTVHMWNGVQFQKQASGEWTPMPTQGGKHPIEQDAAAKHKKLTQILDARKKGKAQEPSFEDRARVATAKHKEISAKEGDLEKRDRDAAGRDQDHREKGLTEKEQQLKDHEKMLTEHSKKLEKLSPKLPLEHQFVGPEAQQALEQKVAKRAPGKGEHVKLTKAELAHTLKHGKYSLISGGKNPNHPEDAKLDDKSVKQRNNELEEELKASGYAYTRIKGHYGGEEDSFLVMVHQADKSHMMALGKKLNQDSIIMADGGKQEMIYTTGDKAGQKHTGEGFEEKPDADDYFSEIDHGDGSKTKFSLKFDWDNLKKDDAASGKDKAKKSTSSQDMIKETKMHKSTKDQHTDPDGSYSEDRSDLHEKIFDKYLSHIKPSDKPVAILLGGGSGSGKSSALRAATSMMGGMDNFVHIDADEMKKDLPEYEAMNRFGDEGAASHAHDESSDLTSELIRRSMDQSKSFVYDSTMKNTEKFKKLIAELKNQGFHVHISYADTDKETATKRAEERAKQTGRKVPQDVINESHDGSRKALTQLHGLADSVVVHDTTTGPPPKTVYERHGKDSHFDKDWHKASSERGLILKSEAKAKAKGKVKHQPDVEKFEKMVSEHKEPYQANLSPVIDEGVSFDEYPRKKSKEAKK